MDELTQYLALGLFLLETLKVFQLLNALLAPFSDVLFELLVQLSSFLVLTVLQLRWIKNFSLRLVKWTLKCRYLEDVGTLSFMVVITSRSGGSDRHVSRLDIRNWGKTFKFQTLSLYECVCDVSKKEVSNPESKMTWRRETHTRQPRSIKVFCFSIFACFAFSARQFTHSSHTDNRFRRVITPSRKQHSRLNSRHMNANITTRL